MATVRSNAAEMREPTFLVLSALAGGRLHGYAIISAADVASAGRVQLKAGTLYTALDRLTQQGLVSPAGEEVVDGRHRRYYELTEPGADALAAEAKRQQANAAHALSQLAARAKTARAKTARAKTARAARPAAAL